MYRNVSRQISHLALCVAKFYEIVNCVIFFKRLLHENEAIQSLFPDVKNKSNYKELFFQNSEKVRTTHFNVSVAVKCRRDN